MGEPAETGDVYYTTGEPAACVLCRTVTTSVVVYRGERRPCCGAFSCEVWATSGINAHLLPSVPWDEFE